MIENYYHDGKDYNRDNEAKYRPKMKEIEEDLKKCQFCGKEFKRQGVGTHEYRCEKNPANDYSIIEELKKMHPNVVQLMDAEQLKEEIMKELWKLRAND